MTTTVRVIDLKKEQDIQTIVANLCGNMGADDYRLVTSFVHRDALFLVFQKSKGA